MKQNNHLIVTLTDFKRHFSSSEFWENRRQFVRDMHPDKVYYWNDELEQAYYNIKAWIESPDDANGKISEKGKKSLSLLTGKIFDWDENPSSKIDLSQKIIKVQAGQTVSLPEYKAGDLNDFKINLHKIEIVGNSESSAKVLIGDRLWGSYYSGEVVYFTEINGGCIELLPNKLSNEVMELTLACRDSEFESDLIVQDLVNGKKTTHQRVTSFAIVYKGYVYIDHRGKPIYFIDNKSFYKYMLNSNEHAVYVKAEDDVVLVLYKNGDLRSTTDENVKKNIRSAKFDKNRIIKINL